MLFERMTLAAPVLFLIASLPEEDTAVAHREAIGFRKQVALELGYDDRNDGFNRSAFSRSKANFSRIRKIKACKMPGFRSSIKDLHNLI